MPQVTVYTRKTCAPCQMVKKYLTIKNIAYTEKDVDADPSLTQEILEMTGRLMVPVIKVGDKVIAGANIPLLSKTLVV